MTHPQGSAFLICFNSLLLPGNTYTVTGFIPGSSFLNLCLQSSWPIADLNAQVCCQSRSFYYLSWVTKESIFLVTFANIMYGIWLKCIQLCPFKFLRKNTIWNQFTLNFGIFRVGWEGRKEGRLSRREETRKKNITFHFLLKVTFSLPFLLYCKFYAWRAFNFFIYLRHEG